MVKRPDLSSESGQGVVEYVLLLAIVVGFYMVVYNGMKRVRAGDLLMRPLTQGYASAYKYGHPRAKGFDEGTPVNHPRAVVDGKNRVFINPR